MQRLGFPEQAADAFRHPHGIPFQGRRAIDSNDIRMPGGEIFLDWGWHMIDAVEDPRAPNGGKRISPAEWVRKLGKTIAIRDRPAMGSRIPHRFRSILSCVTRTPFRGEKKNASRKSRVAESTTAAPDAMLR